MRAMFHGQVLADSKKTIDVDGYVYFPRDTVKMNLLRQAPKTAGDNECPHGVQFFDVVDGKRTGARNAWSYEAPGAAMKKVDRWISFWDQVEIVAD